MSNLLSKDHVEQVGYWRNTNELIKCYETERVVVYRNEVYRVRDNGAIFREARKRKPRRKLDNYWTFGRPNKSTGYMNICGENVHRIVAAAFHGEAPSSKHIVDHIDTNRRNNRADNLRWITRLDNILRNPITLRRIELSYGSLDEFFKNPSKPKGEKLPKNYEWMRTVSKEEAEVSLQRIQAWAESGAQPRGGTLGEWVYGSHARPMQSAAETLTESLTPGALQRNWRISSEFPACPNIQSGESLIDYEQRLVAGVTFSKNKFGSSVVVIAEMGDGHLSVITRFESASVKDYAVARIVCEGQMIVHESSGTFFTLEGAARVYCEQLDVPWKEHCERRSLPWGESIDDFC